MTPLDPSPDPREGSGVGLPGFPVRALGAGSGTVRSELREGTDSDARVKPQRLTQGVAPLERNVSPANSRKW